ncbi:rsbT co-antagonist protein RsbR [Pseudoduganella lurida]|uniref:RsbT co-antagonist protein RsbR n=1 Tax=Pseudoduganella lurida TaxID=1036180 RepID=A0A562RM74_9BURK|nr:STAS domain-containing protein [Pseudoduganella lurida]TWI69714.1 rsbT co-antagonist protein RsbR [Pseudoduganella lurida]
MNTASLGLIAQLLHQHEAPLLDAWQTHLLSQAVRRNSAGEAAGKAQAQRLLQAFAAAATTGSGDLAGPAWSEVRRQLDELSTARARQGFSSTETALFMFSLKAPLFALLREAEVPAALMADATIDAGLLIDWLGLYTIERFQAVREQIILRQQHELLELSTPVVELWEGVLTIPLIGALDSARTQVVMDNLLQKIGDTGAGVVIIDITGVPTVDTLVAQHLLKTVAAARLMGTSCIISGIRPHIAQTIVHLGVDLEDIVTKATLADALRVALRGLATQIVEQPS